MKKYKHNNCNKKRFDLHKMAKEMKNIDFCYLDLHNLNVDIENQSLNLYIDYLKGV